MSFGETVGILTTEEPMFCAFHDQPPHNRRMQMSPQATHASEPVRSKHHRPIKTHLSSLVRQPAISHRIDGFIQFRMDGGRNDSLKRSPSGMR